MDREVVKLLAGNVPEDVLPTLKDNESFKHRVDNASRVKFVNELLGLLGRLNVSLYDYGNPPKRMFEIHSHFNKMNSDFKASKAGAEKYNELILKTAYIYARKIKSIVGNDAHIVLGPTDIQSRGDEMAIIQYFHADVPGALSVTTIDLGYDEDLDDFIIRDEQTRLKPELK